VKAVRCSACPFQNQEYRACSAPATEFEDPVSRKT
jgi:hypothetical protein